MGTRILVTNHPSMNDLSMRLILMSFCYHSEVIHMGHQKGEDIVGEQDIVNHSHRHSTIILRSFVWDTILKRVWRGTRNFIFNQVIEPQPILINMIILGKNFLHHSSHSITIRPLHSNVIPMSFHNTRHDKILMMERPRNEIIARSGIVLF